MAKVISEQRGQYSTDCRRHSFKDGNTLTPLIMVTFADGQEWGFCEICYGEKSRVGKNLNREAMLRRPNKVKK